MNMFLWFFIPLDEHAKRFRVGCKKNVIMLSCLYKIDNRIDNRSSYKLSNNDFWQKLKIYWKACNSFMREMRFSNKLFRELRRFRAVPHTELINFYRMYSLVYCWFVRTCYHRNVCNLYLLTTSFCMKCAESFFFAKREIKNRKVTFLT